MKLLGRSDGLLTGTGELVGEAGNYGPAQYRLQVHDVAEEQGHVAAPADAPTDVYLDGSIKVEHGMNLLQNLSMTLVLEDGRTLDVVHASGEPLAADWDVTCTPVHPAEFRAG
jgi:hypothetical protein